MPHLPSRGVDFDAPQDRSSTNSIKWSGLSGEQLAMGLADMDFPTAPAIIEALQRRVDHGILGYTAPGPSFYDAIVRWMAARHGWQIDPGWITHGPGIMQSLAYLLRGALDPGAGVIVQTPAFSPIPAVIEDNGFAVVENELQLIEDRYFFDLPALEAAASRPDVHAMVLCSPHNPSGRVWSRQELQAVAELQVSHDLLVISDEIHAEMVFAGRTFVPYGGVAAPSTRWASLFGPSKGFNLAGLRTSIAAIADDTLRGLFRRELVRVNEDFGISVMGAVALEAAYSHGAEWLDALTGYLAGNIELLTGGLAHHVPAVRVVQPDASFLVWVDCRPLGFSDAELQRRFDRAGLLLEPGINFGPSGSGFVRVNVGTNRAAVAAAVERMSAALAS